MSLTGNPLIVAVAAVYLVVVLAIGAWAARRTRDSRDFFIAGQRIGLLVTGLATMSAAFSGFVFLGGPGLTYRIGVASLFICLPVGFTSGLLCWVLAKRLRLLAEIREVYTIPDAIACRYRSRPASALAAIAVVLGTVGYLGSQMLALGILIESIFGTREWLGAWSLPAATLVGLVVVLAYSTGGGMLAGVYTDVLQGGWMMLAAMGVFVYALRSGGGIRDIAAAITDSPDFGARFLEPFGGAPVLTAMGFFFVFSIGVLGQPQMLHKFYMLDDPRKLRWMPLVIGLAQSACLLIWLGIGLAVPALVARGRIVAPDSPDAATPAFLLEVTPPLLAATVLAGILAAIMSTADSFVNIGSAALVRDLPGVFGVRVRRELLWGRVATVGIMLAAAGLALTYGDLIALLGTFAFGTFAAALAPALAVGWNWKRVTPAAATASIATGLVLNLGLEFLAKQSWFPGLPRPGLAQGALPAAVSLAASFAVLLLVTLLDPRARPAPEADICAVMDA